MVRLRAITEECFLFVLSLCEVACLNCSADDFSKSPKNRAQYFFLNSRCSNSLSPVAQSIKEMMETPHISEYQMTFLWDIVIAS